LDNEILDFLNTEIEEKLKTVLSQAKKFMRISKRRTLKVDDLNHALKFYNFKTIYGYDSYANAEYERIDSVNGLWRPKQNIIDLEDYLSKPIVSCAMQAFPHFHWISIEGKRPNIPENFIRDTTIPQTMNIDEDANINFINPPTQTQTQSTTQTNLTNIRPKGGNVSSTGMTAQAKIVYPVIHNISKELQMFLENFQQRFRKEIKLSKLNTSNRIYRRSLQMTKELEISLNVVENEPGVVELLPYLIEFLMENLSNQQYTNDPKVHMIILAYMNAIMKNPFFYLEPYIHQLTAQTLSLILMENQVEEEQVDSVIEVKDFAIHILKLIYQRFMTKYPNFIHQLVEVFTDNIKIPLEGAVCYLTLYGAIKAMNELGPAHIINVVIPEFETILNSIREVSNDYIISKPVSNRRVSISTPGETKSKFGNQTQNTQNINITNENNSNLMIVEPPVNVVAPGLKLLSFAQNSFQPTQPIISSIFSDISNTNVIKYEEANHNSSEDEKVTESIIPHGTFSKDIKTITKQQKTKYMRLKSIKTFYVYYALKESVKLTLEYIEKMNIEDEKAENFLKLITPFSEEIIPDLLKLQRDSNASYNTFLDSFI
jgi:hypothetical protein